MEERTLNEAQSLELIARMIRSTRNRLERNAGRPFLIWGYTTVVIALLNYGLRVAGCSPQWSLTWFLIPVAGYLLTRLMPPKKWTEPRTEIDRIVSAVWAVVSLALIPAFIFSLFHGLQFRIGLFPLITLLMGIGTAATGLIVRSRIYTVAGFLGMALSTSFIFYDYALGHMMNAEQYAEMIRSLDNKAAHILNIETLFFAAIFVVMMIIPGHIINHRAKRNEQP